MKQKCYYIIVIDAFEIFKKLLEGKLYNNGKKGMKKGAYFYYSK